MNSQYRTYMKREIKKTYPLLIVGLLFLVFMAVITTSMTKVSMRAHCLNCRIILPVGLSGEWEMW